VQSILSALFDALGGHTFCFTDGKETEWIITIQ